MKTETQTTKGQGTPEAPKYPETLEQVNEWIDAASVEPESAQHPPKSKKHLYAMSQRIADMPYPDSLDRKHSPLPWSDTDRHDNPKSCDPFIKIDNERSGIAYVFGDTKTEREANAKLIVRSVNNAEKLAEALRDVTTAAEIVDGCEHPDDNDIDHMLECFRKSHEALAQWENNQ